MDAKSTCASVIMIIAMAVAFHGQAEAQTSKAEVVTFQFPDGTPIPEDMREVVGSATLKRSFEGLRMEIETTDLEPGAAYTVWWIVFNNPGACDADGCNGTDFGNPDVEASVLWATGRVADEMGEATFTAFVPVGLIRLNRTVEGRERHRFGPGVQNLFKAEIHFIVRCHGPAGEDAAGLLEQLSTVNGGCNGFECFDAQAGAFPLPRGRRAD